MPRIIIDEIPHAISRMSTEDFNCCFIVTLGIIGVASAGILGLHSCTRPPQVPSVAVERPSSLYFDEGRTDKMFQFMATEKSAQFPLGTVYGRNLTINEFDAEAMRGMYVTPDQWDSMLYLRDWDGYYIRSLGVVFIAPKTSAGDLASIGDFPADGVIDSRLVVTPTLRVGQPATNQPEWAGVLTVATRGTNGIQTVRYATQALGAAFPPFNHDTDEFAIPGLLKVDPTGGFERESPVTLHLSGTTPDFVGASFAIVATN